MVSIDYIWLPSLLEAFDLGSEDAFFLLEAIGGYAYIESNSVYSPWTVDYMPKVRNKIQQIKSNTEEEIAEIQWSCRKGNGNKMSTQDIMNYGQVLKTIELFKANGRKYIENIRYEVIINAFVKKGQVLSYLSAAGHIQQKKVKGLPLGFAPSLVEKETIPNEKTPIQPEDELKRLEAMEANNPTDFHNKLRAKELLVKSIDQNAQVSFEQVQAGLSHEQPAPSPDEHPHIALIETYLANHPDATKGQRNSLEAYRLSLQGVDHVKIYALIKGGHTSVEDPKSTVRRWIREAKALLEIDSPTD